MKIWCLSAWMMMVTVCLCGQEPIVVELETENQLEPLYLSDFIDGNSGFGPDYIPKLQKVLTFDLNQNGVTFCVAKTKERERRVSRYTFAEGGVAEEWKQDDPYYVIRVQVTENVLAARVLNIIDGSLRAIEGLSLSGELKEDRRQVHRLADLIHKLLFRKEGVASTRFLYTLRVPGKNGSVSEVWIADFDGANAEPLTKLNSYCVTPVYVSSPLMQKPAHFVFTCYKTGQPRFYIKPLQGGKEKPLLSLPGNQLMPAFSQQGALAFVSDVTGTPDLFLFPFQEKNGKAQQIYHSKGAVEGTPTFDPEGKRVAFVSNKDGSPRIYLMNIPVPGTKRTALKPTLLTKFHRECTAPAWSPDGKKIAYCSKNQGVRQIYVYDFDKANQRCLTSGPGNKENPTWASDSLHLLYNTSDQGKCDIYLLNLRRPEPVKLSSGQGDARYPFWNR